MTPVKQDSLNGKWYMTAFDKVFGPYETEEEAWIAYEKIMNSGSCPTCEE